MIICGWQTVNSYLAAEAAINLMNPIMARRPGDV